MQPTSFEFDGSWIRIRFEGSVVLLILPDGNDAYIEFFTNSMRLNLAPWSRRQYYHAAAVYASTVAHVLRRLGPDLIREVLKF